MLGRWFWGRREVRMCGSSGHGVWVGVSSSGALWGRRGGRRWVAVVAEVAQWSAMGGGDGDWRLMVAGLRGWISSQRIHLSFIFFGLL